MINLESAITQSILGTLFTWAMTTLGALGCLLHYSSIESRKLLDGSLGFAGGVMLAASYWSLLSPAEQLAIEAGWSGSWSFVPLAVGLIVGATFVFLADKYVPISSSMLLLCSDLSLDADAATSNSVSHKPQSHGNGWQPTLSVPLMTIDNSVDNVPVQHEVRQRGHREPSSSAKDSNDVINQRAAGSGQEHKNAVSRRLLLMMIAITIHNIPEGLAVGVAFGAVGQSKTATISKARNLALGIGIQNFPEGLAVSLPLKAAGMSLGRSVWYGQLSGLVEPLAALIGCLAVQFISPILPYALSFAAGAMIYVVFDDIIPEAQQMGNGHLASGCGVLGFVLMMCLDMGLS